MGTTDVSAIQLPMYRVDVVELGKEARRHRIKCEIGVNLKFDTSGLESYCIASWDPRVFDAFVLAGAVQFCDHTKRRHSSCWGRKIELRVPVHDPTLWGSELVSKTLHSVLQFLTGDHWYIEFVDRNKPEPVHPQMNFDMPDSSRVIIPFSDGLDSCAVAGLMEREYGDSLLRVRLGPRSQQKRSAVDQPTPFAVVPYRVCFDKTRSVETSARSRGFRFALLSGIAAYLSQASQVIIPESGQGILGPVLVTVGQAYEDYRSHPLFTNRMSVFFSALFSQEVRYVYPRLWFTKAETLAAFIAICPDGKNWAHTRSCWQRQRQVSVSGRWRQCGICAACMLRRMTVHAIGCSEKKETYVWEDLTPKRFEDGAAEGFKKAESHGAFYEYAIAGTLHLNHLAGLSCSQANQTPLDRQVFQLSRTLELSEQETQQKLQRVLKQHRSEWDAFVTSLGTQSFVSQWALEAPRNVLR